MGPISSDKSESNSGGKRSLMDRLRHRNKNDRPAPEPPRAINTSSTPVPQPNRPSAELQHASSSKSLAFRKASLAPSDDTVSISSVSKVQPVASKKEHHSRLPFKTRRGFSTDLGLNKPPTHTKDGAGAETPGLFSLDTDLTHMEGIVSGNKVPTPLGTNVTGWPGELGDNVDASATLGVWDAPDSWAIKKVPDDAGAKLRPIDEVDVAPQVEDDGHKFHIRIFMPDSSSTTLCLGLNSTALDIVDILCRKSSLLRDSMDAHQIIVRRHGTSRILDGNERPLAIQKRLLEQAGYNESDHIDELGKQDHSYLCRFTFLPAKTGGYSSLEKDPGFNKMQKFNNVDLSGRNLITIPLALYQKASEILSLNLSRNISLDVPKDFIQGCINLREIKYTANEAIRLPPSFGLANKLTVLDISNNSLASLDHIDLSRLENLASLRLANNMLTSLPDYFGNFKTLRSLNLSSNGFDHLPNCVSEIKSLVDLDVSFNAISRMDHVDRLENLERLWATNNKLVGKPEESITNMRSLREMDIRFNAIDNIDRLSQIPQLEHLFAGHNSITVFEGSFAKIRTLYLDHNPVTRFGLNNPVPTLTTLSLASAKLAHLPEDLFQRMSGLTKLILDKNHFNTLSTQFGRLVKLDHLSIAKNSLSALPAEFGRLTELRYLDVRENNLNHLPPEIWLCRKLETLNVSSNVLDAFPKPPPQSSMSGMDLASLPTLSSTSTTNSANASYEDMDKLGEFGPRRMSQASGGYISSGSSPGASQRKGSIASTYGVQSARKPSMLSRTPTDITSPISRKDSMLSTRLATTFSGSLRILGLADNRLSDEVFDQLAPLQELRVVNLSYNDLYDIPPRTIRKWQNLTELYLSGNEMSSLPSEDLEDVSGLRVLHLNGNKFQTLPAELGKLQKLASLDVSSNSLKYNVSNWPYDWNWYWNRNLRFLNLSGNKRLEIKPAGSYNAGGRERENLTDFSTLTSLRILGLMDVTLMIPSVPDQSEDRRVRTSGSAIGSMAYGIADSLGRSEHLSTIDLVVPRFQGHDDEALIGLFDGVALSNGGSKIAKFLQENFEQHFKDELKRKLPTESASEALRRTYLALNNELATLASHSHDPKDRRHPPAHRGSVIGQTLNQDDLSSGCVATVMYIHGMNLFVSNVGDAQAVLIQSEGGHRIITEKHDPASAKERARIRDASGYVSRQGKLNDVLDVSRAFGFSQMMPVVVAAPYLNHITIQESDEMILLASRDLWDYLTFDFVVDLARSERGDLMRAAQKLRDLAIAFGASGKITVMLIAVSDLRRKERARFRTHSMSMGPSGLPDDYMSTRRVKRGRDATLDSKLARLDQEVDAPVGDVSLVFTDIKSSTLLWENYPVAMRAAIKMHNEVMRRHLRLIGGYEVKTEGDAFMVAFPTVTSALLWCFTIQSQLLEVPWPHEILSSNVGQEVNDAEGNCLFRGLSVRMGIHWGQPVCETDPVTRRMDYFGPMVNRAARISAVADGGQITVSSDYIAEVQRLLETHIETDQTNSVGSDDQLNEDAQTAAIRRELRSLSSHGFEVKDLGERRLKGLENPEYIYLMYPHSLAGRLVIQQQRAEAEKAQAEGAGAKMRDSQLTIGLESVWDLWAVSLRLEMLCSSLESPGSHALRPAETALLERTREKGGEVTDQFLVNFVEHQVARIEVSRPNNPLELSLRYRVVLTRR